MPSPYEQHMNLIHALRLTTARLDLTLGNLERYRRGTLTGRLDERLTEYRKLVRRATGYHERLEVAGENMRQWRQPLDLHPPVFPEVRHAKAG